MRSRKSASSASAAALLPWTLSSSRLVLTKPSRASDGTAAPTPAGGAARLRRVALDRVRLQVERLELLQPGRPVGREHAVGLAAAGEDLVALEDDVVLRGVQGHAQVGERAARLGVARQGVGIVVVVGEDGLDCSSAARATISSAPWPWRTSSRTPGTPCASPSRARSAASAWTHSTMNSTRRSARGSGSRMARSKTKAHQTWRAALRAW